MASELPSRRTARIHKPRRKEKSGLPAILVTAALSAGILIYVMRGRGQQQPAEEEKAAEQSGPLIPKPAREGWAANASGQSEPEARPEAAPADDEAGDLGMDSAKSETPAVTLKDGRNWSDNKGHTTYAELITADSTTVTLRREDGKEIKVRQSLLSQADRNYITDWRKAQAALVTTPATRPPLGTPGPVKPGEPAGFGAEWPSSAYVPEELGITIVREDDSDKDYIYESTHFRFTCDVQLRTRLVNECAKVFEATHEFLRLLPLNHRGTKDAADKWPVFIFENYDDYVKAGGPPGSAGVCIYRGNEARVLVPLKSFGVRKTGRDYTVDTGDRDYKVLSHEITHQLMEHQVKQASWYVEGSAEYVAFTPYTGGRYKIAVNKRDIVASVTGYGRDNSGGRALGKEFTMPHLREFMSLSYNAFLADANFNYGVGCLLTYYWYHEDGEGDAARIKRYLDALQKGEKEAAACEKHLLDGRTWEQLDDEFRKALRRFGVRVEFK